MPSVESYPGMTLNTSDINDDLNTIQNSMNITITPEKTPKKTIDDILETNIRNLEDFVDSKVINIYKRPWTKLESRLKTIKIKEFVSSKIQDKTYETEEADEMYKNLIKDIQLSKKRYKVNYSVDDTCIMEVTKIKSKS